MAKHYWTIAAVPNDGENGVQFTIKLKNGCRFKLNECYFTIYKEMFEKHPDSDYFRVDLVTEEDKKSAENRIIRATELLVYITEVPYEIDYLREDLDTNIRPIDISVSKKKIKMLEEIDSQYRKIKKKKELMENVLRLFSLSRKYNVLFEDSEEAYFAMFRVIDEFAIDYRSIDNGYNNVQSMIEKIARDVYGIKLPLNKLKSIAGDFSSNLFDTVFSDIYSKIAWYCEKKNIRYDENILSNAVLLRNKLAHGDNVYINHLSKEYNLVMRLSESFIYEKFFDCINDCHLEAKIVD